MKRVYGYRYEEDDFHEAIQQFGFIKLQLKTGINQTKKRNRYAYSFIYTYFIIIRGNNDIQNTSIFTNDLEAKAALQHTNLSEIR